MKDFKYLKIGTKDMPDDSLLVFGITLKRAGELAEKVEDSLKHEIYKALRLENIDDRADRLEFIVSEQFFIKNAMEQAENRNELLSVTSATGSLVALLAAGNTQSKLYINSIIKDTTKKRLKEIYNL